MLNKIFLLFFLAVVCSFSALGQNTKTLTLINSNPVVQAPPVPGDIRLLTGYSHQQSRGIDSTPGTISKPGGLIVRYDIGRMAGWGAKACARSNSCLWYKEQKIAGHDVWLSFEKNGKITATFPQDYANFYADTKTSEEVADFLLMILTYKAGVNPVPQSKLPPPNK